MSDAAHQQTLFSAASRQTGGVKWVCQSLFESLSELVAIFEHQRGGAQKTKIQCVFGIKTLTSWSINSEKVNYIYIISKYCLCVFHSWAAFSLFFYFEKQVCFNFVLLNVCTDTKKLFVCETAAQ